ncbi:MAG: glycosyltransferase family A protein [Desulfurococcaceae archaeon]
MKVCIYGTVLNNFPFIEESIKSVWRPDAEIIVVDSYSTDGTWEKLLEIRKDYNLRLYRYQCSRGLGRHIALLKCSENSLTAYFDLDTIYNVNFHKAIDVAETYESVKVNGGVVVRREEALAKGGWRDINSAEDTEFAVRIHPKVFVPVLTGENALPHVQSAFREKRYSKGLKYIKRFLDFHIDYVKGAGLNLYDIFKYRSKRLIILSPLILPWTYRSYRLLKKINNLSLENILSLVRLKDPKDLGMNDEFLFMNFDFETIKMVNDGENTVDSFLKKEMNGRLYRIRTSSRNFYLIYIRDFHVLRYYIFLLSLIEDVGVVD